MKNPKKTLLISFLLSTLLLSAASTVHAVEVIATIPVGSEGSMAYDSGMNEIFVPTTNPNGTVSDFVSVISDVTNTVVANVDVGAYAINAAYDSDRGEVFVTTAKNVAVISDSNNSVVATIIVPSVGGLGDLVYDSGMGEIFVEGGGTLFNESILFVISDTTNVVVANITVDPWGLAYDSSKGEIFASNLVTKTIYVISDATNQVVATVDMSKQAYAPGGFDFGPWTLEYDSGKGEVFVALAFKNLVSIISDSTNEVIKNITVGNNPAYLAYDSGRNEIFVTNILDNTTSVISDTTNSVVATIPVGGAPDYIVYDSGKSELFINNIALPETISVLSDTFSIPPSASPTMSASPSPTVPEFSCLAILPLLLSVFFTAAVLRHRKTKN